MPDRFKNIKINKTEQGVRYFGSVIYPDVPVDANDIYVITAEGDRYDLLAQQFYGDSSLWWIIASANNIKRDSLLVTVGVQLRIPNNPSEVRRLFNEVNKNR